MGGIAALALRQYIASTATSTSPLGRPPGPGPALGGVCVGSGRKPFTGPTLPGPASPWPPWTAAKPRDRRGQPSAADFVRLDRALLNARHHLRLVVRATLVVLGLPRVNALGAISSDRSRCSSAIVFTGGSTLRSRAARSASSSFASWGSFRERLRDMRGMRRPAAGSAAWAALSAGVLVSAAAQAGASAADAELWPWKSP